jgi:hypothetical protein
MLPMTSTTTDQTPPPSSRPSPALARLAADAAEAHAALLQAHRRAEGAYYGPDGFVPALLGFLAELCRPMSPLVEAATLALRAGALALGWCSDRAQAGAAHLSEARGRLRDLHDTHGLPTEADIERALGEAYAEAAPLRPEPRVPRGKTAPEAGESIDAYEARVAYADRITTIETKGMRWDALCGVWRFFEAAS